MTIDKLKIATWNIYSGLPWGFYLNTDIDRLNKIIDHISCSDLDILALQEVGTKPLINNLKNKLEHIYDFYYIEKNIVIQYSILFIILFLLYYFIKNVIGLCLMFLLVNFVFKNTTVYNFLLNEIKGGLVFLVKKNINNNNVEILYNDFKEQNGDYLNLINKRGYLILNLTIDNKKITLINTHLNQSYNKCNYRINQIKELNNLLVNNEKYILLGDFNSIKDYNELSFLDKNLIDTLTDSEITWDINNDLTETFLNKSKINRRIDYIFLKNIEFSLSKIIFKEPIASDHYGVSAEIFIKKNKQKSKKIKK